MIDIHCHILPGVDDGPATMAESVEMCRQSYADGVRTVVASPHYLRGGCDLTADRLRDAVSALNAMVRQEGIPLTVLPGADVAVVPDLGEHARQEPWITVNGSGRYLLTEFPHDTFPSKWQELLRSLFDAGIVPVITHPERHPWLVRRHEIVHRMVEMGALIQVTAMSITGEFGPEARRCCERLLREGLAHVIASDAHSAGWRPPSLSRAVAAAAQIVGEEAAREMVSGRPAQIIAGGRVIVRPVSAPEKRGWLQRTLERYRQPSRG